MEMFCKSSEKGNLEEAVRGLRDPKLILMMVHDGKFEAHVEELEKLFPGVPSIGITGMGYTGRVTENGVIITAFTGNVSAAAGVLETVSAKPARNIGRLISDLGKVRPGNDNTALIDFCSGNDACVVSTLEGVVKKHHLAHMGATSETGDVSANGRVYRDSAAYAVIKNDNGKVRSYKENIYVPREGVRLLASKTDKKKYYIGELNGRPAKQVYMELTDLKGGDIGNQTFSNPLGRINGEDISIVSLKGTEGNGITCYRQVNDSDILTLLELKDPMEVARQTIDQIRADFRKVSAIFSVNCVFRYLLMSERGEFQNYVAGLDGVASSCGVIGYGEHIDAQFANQTMTCVVFE